MKVHIRNEEGTLVPLEIITLKGETGPKGDRGDKGESGITPNISVGEVTTVGSDDIASVTKRGTTENTIFDFAIPKGESGVYVGDIGEAPETADIVVDDSDLGLTYLNEELIDDNTISNNTTWSSSKIEDCILTNDNTVWLDANGENLKVNSTKEGYLREVEIWGNTIQNEEDLSDIKHLGELYVNELGEPILDDLDREQYKIDIKTVDGFNLYNNSGLTKVKSGETYHFGWTLGGNQNYNWHVFTINAYDENKEFLEEIYKKNIGHDDIVIPNNCSFIEIKASHNGETFLIEKCFWSKKDTINNIFIKQSKSHKTTILLPCQLMRVGDVADRLYWDSEKGRYVVEKNVAIHQFAGGEGWKRDTVSATYATYKITSNCFKKQPILGTNKPSFSTKSKSVTKTGIAGEKGFPTSCVGDTTSYAFFFNLKHSEIGFDNSTGVNFSDSHANQWIIDNKPLIYYATSDIELIETNITEQIKLPTYINTTYITVNGGISGSIKAKAPVDGSSVVNNLVQSNYELKQENEEIKAINEEQDEIINISLMATDEIFMMLEPLLDIATLSNENATSKIADMYRIMVNKGLKKIEDVPERYRIELTKEGE